MNKNIKKNLSLILVMALLVSMVSVNAKAENDTDKGVCSVDNPEACEISIPDGVLEEEPESEAKKEEPKAEPIEESSAPAPEEVVEVSSQFAEAPAVETAPAEPKVSSPKTGEVYELASLKSKNLSKNLSNKDITFAKAEYTNVKGDLTTKANGKPKIIIISKYKCYYCDLIRRQVEGYVNDGSLKDVDVIQVNIEESEVSSDAWNYIYYISNKYSIGTPFIAYINSNNEIVEYTEQNKIKNGDILEQINDLFGDNLESQKYTIKYDGNSATGGKMSTQINIENGETYTIPANKFSKKGYKFAGWALSKSGKVVYKNKDKIKNVNKDITLYAKWAKETYKITYKLNLKNVQNNSKNPKSYTVTTKTFSLKAPVSYDKTKYKFQGWYTKKTGGKKVASIKKGSLGKVTLYARWKKL